MRKDLVSMLNEKLHCVNDIMSPTCTRYSSDMSVSCLAFDPNLLSVAQHYTQQLHELWTRISWEMGSLGILFPLVGRREKETMLLFLFGTKLLWQVYCQKKRDEVFDLSAVEELRIHTTSPLGEKAGPSRGLWSG